MNEYRVQTDVYSGPMELLLFLIKRDEIDLTDIPVARICEQYVRFVEMLRVIDPNVAGEFLIMATVLMELKSRMLLPTPPTEAGDEEDPTDPRLELVRQLLEYKKYKDASFELQCAAEEQSRRWPRVPTRLRQAAPSELELDDVQIWDLVAAFNRVMASIGAGAATHDVVFDDTPISLHAADIIDRLERENGDMNFEAIFLGRRKAEMIGLFLALLELMRQSRVRVMQDVPAAPILVKLLSSEPISIGAEWGAAFESALLGAPAPELEMVEETVADVERLDAPSRPANVTDDDAAPIIGLEFDEELDARVVAEMDAIKTDMDIDGILHAALSDVEPSEDTDQPNSNPNGLTADPSEASTASRKTILE